MTATPLAGRRVLEGKRVLVTRAAHQAGKLSEGLRALGVEPVEVPVLEIQPPQSYAALDDALTHLDRFDWLIFTSANTIPIIHVRLMDLDVPRSSIHAKTAAIGNATAKAVDALLHLEVSITPTEYVAESLVAELAPQIAGKRVLLARAEIARDAIPDALRAAGATVDVVDAYRNVLPEAAPELLSKALADGIAAATFTSSSSVTHLADAARVAGIAFPFAGVVAVSIGPITSQTLRDLGWEPAAEAKVSDIAGLIDAVDRVLRA
jgi:uroporphyrinogen-III synthase/uroporphyrinogen III methyltransferase/synthase